MKSNIMVYQGEYLSLYETELPSLHIDWEAKIPLSLIALN